MARLHTSGGEIRDHNTVAAEASPDGRSAGAALTTTDTGIFRGGSASIKCNGTSVNTSFREWVIAPAAGTGIYARVYLRFSALPSATKKVLRIGTVQVSARLTSAGNLQLWNDAAGTQIGSDSALTLAVDTFYRVELYGKVGAGSIDAAELRVTEDDETAAAESVASTSTVSITDTNPTVVQAGWIDAPGVTSSMYLDGIGVNDSSGTKNNSWPNAGTVALVLKSVVGSGGSDPWTYCTGVTITQATSGPLFVVPPIGEADATNHSVIHQVRNAATTSMSLSGYLKSYASAGLQGNVLSDQLTSPVDDGVGTFAQVFWGQSFYMAGTLDYAEVELKTNGALTDDVVAQIRTDSSGLPSDTVIASATIPGSSLTSTYAWFRFAFPSTPLAAGSQYWLVLTRSGTGDSYVVKRVGAPQAADHWTTTATTGSGDWATAVNRTISFRLFNSDGFGFVAAIAGLACHGEASGTGTKSGAMSSQASPVISSSAFTYGGDAGACTVYPTNWRWKTVVVDEPNLRSADERMQLIISKSDGTNRAACCCFMGAYIDYHNPPSEGWVEFVKTADSTHWWAKRVSVTTEFYQVDDTSLVVLSGDWAIQADPISDPNMNVLASITDDALQAGYTRA
jgi:hypothetical protein